MGMGMRKGNMPPPPCECWLKKSKSMLTAAASTAVRSPMPSDRTTSCEKGSQKPLNLKAEP